MQQIQVSHLLSTVNIYRSGVGRIGTISIFKSKPTEFSVYLKLPIKEEQLYISER